MSSDQCPLQWVSRFRCGGCPHLVLKKEVVGVEAHHWTDSIRFDCEIHDHPRQPRVPDLTHPERRGLRHLPLRWASDGDWTAYSLASVPAGSGHPPASRLWSGSLVRR